jgi:hypothetical protein
LIEGFETCVEIIFEVEKTVIYAEASAVYITSKSVAIADSRPYGSGPRSAYSRVVVVD